MTEDELLSLLEKEERNCISSTSGALAEQRREALQYYYGQPYGNEIEGRSQVVTTEVKDAVEGIMPTLMQIFTASDEIVRFEPQNPDDEAAAQQATDYINYVFSRLNNGFTVLYCLFKDALLQKNGYSKVYWENYEDATKETYEGLSDDQLAMVRQDDAVEVVSIESRPDEYAAQQIQMQIQQLQAMGQEVPNIPVPQLHDVVLKRTKKYGKVCIDPVPPEEVLISKETPNDITKARFVEHRTRRTISQIREMGYDIEDTIADFSPSTEFNEERYERNRFDESDAMQLDQSADPSTRLVWLCEAYLWVDYDGDGIAEYRKVTKVGKTILDNEEFDSLPIVGGTAIMMPHKHYGLSIHDLVKDVQLIKSTITRQLLDNAYVANNGRMVVLDGMVNMDDLLNSRPNGIVRAKAMNAVQRMDNPLLGAPFYNLLEYFDKVKVNRVGARDFGDAVDPNALNAKAHTAELVSSAAQERINLMARILAEGPVKHLFLKIMELYSKHQDKPQVVKLRGKWVQVDPREWHNRFNMTVTVGLGTGSQSAVLQSAMGIMEIQGGMLKSGLMGRVLTEQNVFHAARKYAKAAFPRDYELMFTDPSTLPPAKEQPNPDLLKIELAAHKAEMGDKQKRDKMQLDAQLQERDRQFQAYMSQVQAQIDAAKMEMERRAEREKMEIDHMREIQKTASSRDESMIDSVTKLRVAEQQAQSQHSNTVLAGMLERMTNIQQQAHEQHMQTREHLIELAKLASAEKEIVRDEKGKAKGVRPKKDG
jgi:hypothetical protein